MANPLKKLNDNKLIDINCSGAFSVDDSGDIDYVETPNVESDSETIDKLEVDQLYDSDENEQYVSSFDNDIGDDEEERNVVESKGKRRKIFTSFLSKGTASICTSAAFPATNGKRREKQCQEADVSSIVDFNKTISRQVVSGGVVSHSTLQV